VKVEDLLVSQPDHSEQALEIADRLVATGAVDLIVVDSVAALVPKAEIEGEMGDSHMGLQARLMSQALRKLTAATARNQTVVVFIKKLYESEAKVREVPADQRLRTRQAEGKPVWEKLCPWCDTYRPHQPPTSKLARRSGI
jgi:RecA/RadA recombinase